MDMSIGTVGEKDSPLSKDELSLLSRAQSMEDVVEEDGYKRGHRLSLQPSSKMTNYLKFLQELAIRQASGGSMASQLFSTAVISGSSSVPNLGAGGNSQDTPCYSKEDWEVSRWLGQRGCRAHPCYNWGYGEVARCLAQIGEDGTPTIRPLETLHNALSLRQIDSFLQHVTTANFKTPGSSPRLISPEKSADSMTSSQEKKSESSCQERRHETSQEQRQES